MRILPHAQDTGGFFVAVLQKTAPCPWESKKAYENGESNNGGGQDAGKGIETALPTIFSSPNLIFQFLANVKSSSTSRTFSLPYDFF